MHRYKHTYIDVDIDIPGPSSTRPIHTHAAWARRLQPTQSVRVRTACAHAKQAQTRLTRRPHDASLGTASRHSIQSMPRPLPRIYPVPTTPCVANAAVACSAGRARGAGLQRRRPGPPHAPLPVVAAPPRRRRPVRCRRRQPCAPPCARTRTSRPWPLVSTAVCAAVRAGDVRATPVYTAAVCSLECTLAHGTVLHTLVECSRVGSCTVHSCTLSS
jgi:hypothetical protein